MLPNRAQQAELDGMETAMRLEWTALIDRLSDADIQAMQRTQDRLEAHALAGCEAELAPYDAGAVRHLIQLHACAMASLHLIRFVEGASPGRVRPRGGAGSMTRKRQSTVKARPAQACLGGCGRRTTAADGVCNDCSDLAHGVRDTERRQGGSPWDMDQLGDQYNGDTIRDDI